MIAGAMHNLSCNECGILAEELKSVYAQLWESMDERTRDACLAGLKMIEEDSEQAQALLKDPGVWETALARLPKFQPSLSPDPEKGLTPVGKAIARTRMHKIRTGHKIPTELGFWFRK